MKAALTLSSSTSLQTTPLTWFATGRTGLAGMQWRSAYQNGMQIGFVPEDYAVDVAPLLDSGLPHDAFITKVLTGGRSPIPVVQAYLHRADASSAHLVFEKDVPAKVPPPQPSGCTLALLLAAL